jgi:hypothetical protein
VSWVAVAVGGFYVFAGVVLMRTMRLDRLMDDVLVALEGKPASANERWKSAILTAGAYLTLASGAALATLSALAVPLFLANVVVQGGYLLWAGRALPPADAEEGNGRRHTTNAFVVYAAAAAFVVWLSVRGGLRARPMGFEAIMIEALTVGAIVVASWASMFVPRSWFGRTSSTTRSPRETVPDPRVMPAKLRLRPDWQSWPLWDAETGENVSHYHLDLPDGLAERIEAWDDTMQETYNSDDPPSSGFKTDNERRAYREEGKAIARELTGIWPGSVEIPDEFL